MIITSLRHLFFDDRYCKIFSSSIVLVGVDHSLGNSVGVVVGVYRCVGVSQGLAQCGVVGVHQVNSDVC